MKKVKNFARFYALLKGMEGDPNELKKQFVFTYTRMRTTSIREMTPTEYNQMCDDLQAEKNRNLSESDFTAEIKAKRSAVLKRLQKLGLDTTDWKKVDHYVLNPRISGKRFALLTIEELTALIPKLEAIINKRIDTSPGDLVRDYSGSRQKDLKKSFIQPEPDPVPEEIKYLLYFPKSMLN